MNTNNARRLDALRSGAILPLSFFTLAGVGAVAIIGLVEPAGSNGFIETFLGVLVIINLFYYLQSGNLRITSQALVVLIGSFLSVSLYNQTASRIGIFWLVIFPVIAVLLLGRRIALVFIGIFVVSLLPSLALSGDWLVDYSIGDLFAVVLGVILISIFLIYYDYILEKSTIQIVKDSSIDDTSNNLKSEIAQRQNAEAQMTKALKELEENNKKYEQVSAIDEATISSIGEAVLVVDKSGKITRANPSSGRVLGINQKELISNLITTNLSLAKLSDENTVLAEEQIVILLSMSHRSINEETYKVTRPDKSSFYAQMTASPLVVSGEVYGAVVVIRDVTSEVTVDQAKGEFVSIASHQLRTPLSTINWYLEMVLAGDFGEINKEQREFIQEAYMAGKRMGDLINALLNASRLDVGVIAVEPVGDVDIRDILKGVITDLELKISKKEIKLKVNIEDSVQPAKLDVRIMEIIFLNLLTNAVKYSPVGSEVVITASVEGDNIDISVIDKGYGIPIKVQDKIFTKMFRADNAIEHEPDGNGLGLYIIKSILDTIGGSISFVSKEGEGTIFTVCIPKTGMQARDGAKQLSLNQDLN